MWIKITSGIVAAHARRKPGDVIQLPDSEGRYLVAIGKAIACEEPAAEKKPAPKRRSSKKK